MDDGQANGGDDQYDGADYDKESQQKNDIHLAGEDEGEGNLRTIESIRPRNWCRDCKIILVSEFQTKATCLKANIRIIWSKESGNKISVVTQMFFNTTSSRVAQEESTEK